jgi:hypothetical protein
MPTFLTPDQLAAENAADARKIRAAMSEFLLRGSRVSSSRPRFHIPKEGDSDYPEFRQSVDAVLYGRARSGVERAGDMLMLPQGVSSKMIPMSEIMQKQDEKHNDVLKKPWFVQETSNREEVMAEYIRDNADELLKHVPVNCSKFRLLWEQRLAIVSMTVAMPAETFTSCEIPREAMDEITQPGRRKQPFVIRYSLEKNMLPVFTVADYCTGSGKTIMAISAALSLLCSRERWSDLKANYVSILRARIRENNSGLCKMESVESARLARLAIMFVPATVLSAWHQFCQSAVFGAKEAFGQSTDVLVWKGVGGRTQSVEEALHSGKPVLWVLPMESDSLKVVQKYPDIGYAVRIFDEMNMRMVQRYDKPESTALFNYVVRAPPTRSHQLPSAPTQPCQAHTAPCPHPARRPKRPSRACARPPTATPATRCAWPSAATTAPSTMSRRSWATATTRPCRPRSSTSARCGSLRRPSSSAASSRMACRRTCHWASGCTK